MKRFKPKFFQKGSFITFTESNKRAWFTGLLFFYKDKLYLTYNVMIKGPVLFL